MSNQEAPLSGNFKIGNFQQTVRGNNIEEYKLELLPFQSHPDVAQVLAIIDGKEHEQAVAVAQQVFPNSTVVETTGVPQQQTFAPVPPPSAQPVATSSAPSCHHGTKTAKKGSGAKGEWRAWMCPAPKGTADQCSPAWVTKGTAEWVNFPA